jgi:hypothetical protein
MYHSSIHPSIHGELFEVVADAGQLVCRKAVEITASKLHRCQLLLGAERQIGILVSEGKEREREGRERECVCVCV